MTALAGETTQEGGLFQCGKCKHPVRVSKGEPIPKCPNCGHDLYDARRTDENRGG